jgi:7-cyano-7-deazaguanine synthase
MRINGTSKAELRAATRIGRAGKVVEHRFVSISELREAGDIKGSGPLSGGAVPPTYIPMKNAIYYSLAAAFAEEKGSSYIIGGHNKDDGRIFEDTGEEFFRNLQRTLRAASARLRQDRMRISRPLRSRNKAQVVALAARLGVPFELTWSCHRGGEEPCRRCAGCLQRAEAFADAGIADPLFSNKV